MPDDVKVVSHGLICIKSDNWGCAKLLDGQMMGVLTGDRLIDITTKDFLPSILGKKYPRGTRVVITVNLEVAKDEAPKDS